MCERFNDVILPGDHYPNPFYPLAELNNNRNLAIVLPTHIVGYQIGQEWTVGEMVSILPAPADRSEYHIRSTRI